LSLQRDGRTAAHRSRLPHITEKLILAAKHLCNDTQHNRINADHDHDRYNNETTPFTSPNMLHFSSLSEDPTDHLSPSKFRSIPSSLCGDIIVRKLDLGHCLGLSHPLYIIVILRFVADPKVSCGNCSSSILLQFTLVGFVVA
jgi:hypothetical protein